MGFEVLELPFEELGWTQLRVRGFGLGRVRLLGFGCPGRRPSLLIRDVGILGFEVLCLAGLGFEVLVGFADLGWAEVKVRGSGLGSARLRGIGCPGRRPRLLIRSVGILGLEVLYPAGLGFEVLVGFADLGWAEVRVRGFGLGSARLRGFGYPGRRSKGHARVHIGIDPFKPSPEAPPRSRPPAPPVPTA